MNNRLRTIRRNIPREERYKAKYWDKFWGYSSEVCPCCNNSLRYKSWTEDGFGTVERLYECKSCGYKEHEAYGLSMVRVGAEVFEYGYSPSEKEVVSVNREIEQAVRRWRERRKHEVGLSYRKKKSQRKRG